LFVALQTWFCATGSFESLGDVGESDREGLDSSEGPLEVKCIAVGVDATKLHHLLATELNLKVFRRFLSDTAAKVELVDLVGLVPNRRLVLQNELALRRSSLLIAALFVSALAAVGLHGVRFLADLVQLLIFGLTGCFAL